MGVLARGASHEYTLNRNGEFGPVMRFQHSVRSADVNFHLRHCRKHGNSAAGSLEKVSSLHLLSGEHITHQRSSDNLTISGGTGPAKSLFAKPHYIDRRNDDPEQFVAISWVGNRLYSVIFEFREDAV